MERKGDLREKGKILWFVNSVFTEKDINDQLEGHSKGWLVTLAHALKARYELVIVGIHPNAQNFQGREISTVHLRPKYWKWKFLYSRFLPLSDMNGVLTEQMLEVVDRERPDLVHIHGTEEPFINAHTEIRSRGIPVLVSIQGLMMAIENKFFGGYDRSFIASFSFYRPFRKPNNFFLPQSLMHRFKRIQKRARSEANVLPEVEYFEGRTEWDKAITHLLNPRARYFHVDRILKPAFYSSKMWQSRGKQERPYIIWTTMGTSLFKGLDTIVECAKILNERQHDFIWLVAGVSPDDGSVRAAKKKCGHSYPKDQINFLGALNAEQLVDQMLTADIYVSASYVENSPNNLAEAMILGMPCIATLAGGTASYLEHERSGLLTQEGDIWGMAAAIFRLLEQRELAEKMGKEAYRRARKRHDRSRAQGQIESAYQYILSEVHNEN